MTHNPSADSLTIRNARLLTIPGGRPKRGAALRDLGVIELADILIRGQHIHSIHSAGTAPDAPTVIDARGRVLMPAFVDPHTHACWVGDRLDEWDRKRAGATYLELLRAGGGIMSTVRSVRGASFSELRDALIVRLHHMRREGTLCAEVKSGYDLTTDGELRMLHAVRSAAEIAGFPIAMTACIGHAVDPDVVRADFIARTIQETLDAVHCNYPDAVIDAYCEEGAWTLDESAQLFSRAIELGHPVRVHVDQFHPLGMTDWAIEHASPTIGESGVRSVDHLEATPRTQLIRIAASTLFAVLLPCTGFHTDGRYADGRTLADAGGAISIATNYNPGSAPTLSMPCAIALAVRFCGLTPAEAIVASTANAASLLGFNDRGSIYEGARADLILLRHTDERMLAYEFGGNPVDAVICGGQLLDRMLLNSAERMDARPAP